MRTCKKQDKSEAKRTSPSFYDLLSNPLKQQHILLIGNAMEPAYASNEIITCRAAWIEQSFTQHANTAHGTTGAIIKRHE